MAYLFQQIITFISKLFKRQRDTYEKTFGKTDKTHEEFLDQNLEPSDGAVSSIVFGLNKVGDIDIQFYWKELNPTDDYYEVQKMANNYAVLISLIDEGGLKSNMVLILADSYKENTEENKIFINLILENLLEHKKNKEKKNSQPLINPSKIFKQYEQE